MADGKWIDGVTAGMSPAGAARIVLETRFAVVRDALPRAVEEAAADVEHVHRLRVATRRAGAALRLLGECLHRKYRKRAKATLRTLRRASGDARDWDVFLGGLAQARPLQTATGKPALDFLLGYALSERAAAQRALVEAARDAGPEYEAVCHDLPKGLHGVGDHPAATYGQFAERCMGALFADFQSAVDADPSEPADLHRLRIGAKRVRYAMELFVDCFAAHFRDDLYPAVERLQAVLGEHQDAHVGVGRLEDLRERIKAAMPAEWARLRPGLDGLKAALRRKLPLGRKQFQGWRSAWEKLREERPAGALQTIVEENATA